MSPSSWYTNTLNLKHHEICKILIFLNWYDERIKKKWKINKGSNLNLHEPL